MSRPLPPEIIEATHLTQAGRLREATELLQRLLAGAGPGTGQAAGDAAGRAIALPPPAVDEAAQGKAGLERTDAPRTGARDTAEPHAGPLSRILERFHPGRPGQALRRALECPPPASTGVVPPTGAFVAGTFSNPSGSRAYKLYIPSRHAGEPRPLIVMLHGCSQSPDDFAAGTRMNFAAERHDCYVVYPEQAAAANASRCWNWFETGHQQRGRGEPDIIAGITRQVMADHNIDPRRIYVAGLSAGGAAAAVVGETYADLYAAIGVHSGLACGVARDLASAFAAMQGQHPAPARKSAGRQGDAVPVPTIVFHGDKDATVHPRNGSEVIVRAGMGGDLDVVVEQGRAGAGHAYTRSVQHDASGRGILEQWVIHGAGHAWSGGNPAGSFVDPHGPDATKEMLRFFLEHVRGSEKPDAQGA